MERRPPWHESSIQEVPFILYPFHMDFHFMVENASLLEKSPDHYPFFDVIISYNTTHRTIPRDERWGALDLNFNKSTK